MNKQFPNHTGTYLRDLAWYQNPTDLTHDIAYSHWCDRDRGFVTMNARIDRATASAIYHIATNGWETPQIKPQAPLSLLGGFDH